MQTHTATAGRLFTRIAEGLRAHFEPPPLRAEDRQPVMLLLVALSRADGFLFDGDYDDHDAVINAAMHSGLINCGSGWGVGIALTERGKAALRQAGL